MKGKISFYIQQFIIGIFQFTNKKNFEQKFFLFIQNTTSRLVIIFLYFKETLWMSTDRACSRCFFADNDVTAI